MVICVILVILKQIDKYDLKVLQKGENKSMGIEIKSSKTVADSVGDTMTTGISGLDGTITASGITITNINLRGRVDGVNEQSKATISSLKSAIRADIIHIRSLADEFEGFDKKIAATNLLKDILHN